MNGLNPSKYTPSSPIRTEPFSSCYTVDEDIGRGKFAVVRKCTNKETGEVVAAKVIRKRRKGKSCREEILREVVMLEYAMAHPRLVSLREVFETQSELILVTEYCSGGELFDECVINESFKEDDVRKLLVQILEGLAFLHDNNIVHLDLKPQNILLTKPFPEGDIKICDLGFACLTNTGEDIRDIIGTPDYVAPEVLDYEPLNIQTDMWSLGVLTYVMLTACSPFAGDNQQETFCNITQVKMEYPEELFGHINPLAKDFIEKLLVKKARDRLTARQCLQHPWLKDLTNSMSIHVPSPDHSEELAHDMVTPSNWHMSPDRRVSLTGPTVELPGTSFDFSSTVSEIAAPLPSAIHANTDSIQAPSTAQGKSNDNANGDILRNRISLSDEKDNISNTLSHIDIDRNSIDRSSSTSFETCPESFDGGFRSVSPSPEVTVLDAEMTITNTSQAARLITSAGSHENCESNISTAVETISTETAISTSVNSSQDNSSQKTLNARLHYQTCEDHGENGKQTGSNSMNLDKSAELLCGSSKVNVHSSDESNATTSALSSRDSNKNENHHKRMSMEIPPKRAKCIEEEQGNCSIETPQCPSANHNPNILESSGAAPVCNGSDDYRTSV